MADKRLKRHPQVKTKILPDGYVLLHIQEINWVYTLTPLGGLVWEFCDGERSIEDLVFQITEIKEIAADPELQVKVEHLISNLEQAGLLIDKEFTEIPALIGKLLPDNSQEVESNLKKRD